MDKERSYLDFRKGAGWTTRGSVTPFAREDFKVDPHRWRQLANLQLPQLGPVFRPMTTFKPFKWAREKRAAA